MNRVQYLNNVVSAKHRMGEAVSLFNRFVDDHATTRVLQAMADYRAAVRALLEFDRLAQEAMVRSDRFLTADNRTCGNCGCANQTYELGFYHCDACERGTDGYPDLECRVAIYGD